MKINPYKIDKCLEYNGKLVAFRYEIEGKVPGNVDSTKVDMEVTVDSSPAWVSIVNKFKGNRVKLVPHNGYLITKEEIDKGIMYPNVSDNPEAVKQLLEFTVRRFGGIEEQEAFFTGTAVKRAVDNVVNENDKQFYCYGYIKTSTGLQYFKGTVKSVEYLRAKAQAVQYLVDNFQADEKSIEFMYLEESQAFKQDRPTNLEAVNPTTYQLKLGIELGGEIEEYLGVVTAPTKDFAKTLIKEHFRNFLPVFPKHKLALKETTDAKYVGTPIKIVDKATGRPI